MLGVKPTGLPQKKGFSLSEPAHVVAGGKKTGTKGVRKNFSPVSPVLAPLSCCCFLLILRDVDDLTYDQIIARRDRSHTPLVL